MEERDSCKVVEDFFLKINYIRNTVDGILVCGNTNVWNVFGGLSRTKKAVFDVITDNLRHSDLNAIQELCSILIQQYECTDLRNDVEDSENMLLFWIEHHLLSHSLYPCFVELFKCKKNDRLLTLYKEFSFMKNGILVDGLINCLFAIQQNCMEQLAGTNPLLINKSKFFDEILPWVKEKTDLEYKVNLKTSLSPTTIDIDIDINCEYCDLPLLLSDESAITCNCNKDKNSVEHKQKKLPVRSFSQDVLIKSALSAVYEQPEESVWYDENGGNESLNDLRHRLSRMKDLCRSDSSLFHEVEHLEKKEVLSDQDLARSQESINNKNEKQSPGKTSLEDNFNLPRSSSSCAKKPSHHTRSKSDQIGLIPLDSQDGVRHQVSDSTQISSSLPKENIFSASTGGGSSYYRSEDGQLFPKPYEGQSLISYLDSRSYDTGAQLDKENAHFSICEALITAIEQMRCEKQDSSSDGSDDEIKFLKREISNRKKILRKKNVMDDNNAFSDRSDTGRSSTSFKTSSTISSSSSSNPDDRIADPDRLQLNISASWENVSLLKSKSPENPKMNATFEKIEIIKEEEIPPEEYSAEAVAKSLLKKFDGRSIPAASELKWMVTAEDVPQQLLPLPTSWPISSDTHLEEDAFSFQSGLKRVSMPSLLRGNLEWAPPRPQIIFSPHPFVKRKVLLQRQHFRCAGCGLKVTPNLSKRFRYCEYLGKYFCSSCHQNKLCVIPSKILSKWDFKKYPVSDFAKELLKKIYRDPLFNILDIAPRLYKNVRSLATVRNLRLQLYHVKKFLTTCSHAGSFLIDFEKLSLHLSSDPHSYSIDDMVQVKTGELQINLKYILNDGISHIKDKCLLCSAKGFVCEICQDGNDVLYPFDLTKVSICHDCSTCYHKHCYVEGKCGRCERLRARKLLLQESENAEDG